MASGKQSGGPQPVNSHVSIYSAEELMEVITDRLCPYDKIWAQVQC